jgi:prepilin peptidase CpaA
MALFSLDHWPLLFVSAAMIVAAVIDGWKLKVPNWLTFPLVIGGWVYGLCVSCGWLSGHEDGGGIGPALLGTLVGFLLLLPVYAIGGMGAGDVKMQMGFGAWVGAYFGVAAGLRVIWWAFAVAVIIGGVLALGMMVIRGRYRQNMANTREIFGDLLGANNVGQIADRAAKRKPRMHLLPYGIPLCLGFVGYLIYVFGI